MVKAVLYSLGILLLLGCKKNNPFVTVSVNLEDFHEVQLNSPFEAVLQEDTLFFIEFIGYQKTVEAIDYSVENGVLKLENNLSGRFLKPKTNQVKLIIHSKPLSLLQANETCEISTNTPITSDDFGLIMKSKGNFADLELNGKTFYFWNNYPCGGKLILRGKTDELKLWTSAIFSVDAKEVAAKYAFVENNSKGNCVVNVSEKLEYNIRGEGGIEVYGQPGIVVKHGNDGDGQFVMH